MLIISLDKDDMIKLVIFDLDGTLINSIGDIANSANCALKKYGFPEHPTNAYNFFVGDGINKLFERALPKNENTSENILIIRKFFVEHYKKHDTDYSKPYNDILQLLKSLQNQNVLLAVASNKYHEATFKLVNHFFSEIKFAAVLGQCDGTPLKPDPTIVNNILSIAGVTRKETLYVGDSGVDMQTAINSEITACGVTWGFRPRSELEQYNPAYLVDEPKEIEMLINSIS